MNIPPLLTPHQYTTQSKIEYGVYLVLLKNGKYTKRTYNNTGWSYDNRDVDFYYLPKIN